MTKKKKNTPAILPVLLAAALAACGQGGAPTPDATTGGAAVPAATATAGAAAAPLRLLKGAYILSTSQTAAYLIHNPDGGAVYLATTIDFSDGVERVLCNTPGCTHSDESCPAWVYTSPSYTVANSELLCDGDALYWMVDGRLNDSADAFIDVSDLDGGNRRRLVGGADFPDLSSAYLSGCIVGDGSALYLTTCENTEENVSNTILWRLDKATGALTQTNLGTGANGDSPWMIGTWGSQMLFQYTAAGDTPAPPADDADADAWDAYADATEAAREGRTLEIRPVGTDGVKGEPLYTWTSRDAVTEYSRERAADGVYYELRAPSGDLDSIDLATGARTTLAPALTPDAVTAELHPLPDGKLLADTTTRQGDELVTRRYILDPNGGTKQELAGTWLKNGAGSPRPPVIYASNGESLLLMAEIRMSTVSGLGDDGQFYNYNGEDFVYDVAPLADYLAGSTDWTNCTLLGPLI